MLGKFIAGIVGGVVVAAFGVPLLGMILAHIGVTLDRVIPALFLIVIAATVVAAMFARRTARAWRYVLITAAGCSLGLFLAHMLPNPLLEQGGDTLGLVGLLSFFTGVILLLIGLLVGRESTR